MTPEKQEAIRLINLFSKVGLQTRSEGIECALICVDEILKTRPGFPYPDDVGLVIKGIFNIINYPALYWQEVKQEIEKL